MVFPKLKVEREVIEPKKRAVRSIDIVGGGAVTIKTEEGKKPTVTFTGGGGRTAQDVKRLFEEGEARKRVREEARLKAEEEARRKAEELKRQQEAQARIEEVERREVIITRKFPLTPERERFLELGEATGTLIQRSGESDIAFEQRQIELGRAIQITSPRRVKEFFEAKREEKIITEKKIDAEIPSEERRLIARLPPADLAVFPIKPDKLTIAEKFEQFISEAKEAPREALKEIFVEGFRVAPAIGKLFKPAEVFFPKEIGELPEPAPPFVTRGTIMEGEVPPEFRISTALEKLQREAVISGTTATIATARGITEAAAKRIRPEFEERITPKITPEQLEKLTTQFQERIEKETIPRLEELEMRRGAFLARVEEARKPVIDIERIAETAAFLTVPISPVGAAIVGGEFVGRGIPRIGRGVLARELPARERAKLVGIGAAQIALGLGVFRFGVRRIERQIDIARLESLVAQKPEIQIGRELLRTEKASLLAVRTLRKVGEARLGTRLKIPIVRTKEGFRIVGAKAVQKLRFPSFELGKFITIKRRLAISVPKGVFKDPTQIVTKVKVIEKQALEGVRGAAGRAFITERGAREVTAFDVGGVAREQEGFLFFAGGRARALRIRKPIVRIGKAGRFPTIKVLREPKITARFDISAVGIIKRMPLEKERLVIRTFTKQTTRQVQQQALGGAALVSGIEKEITRQIVPTLKPKIIPAPAVARVITRPARAVTIPKLEVPKIKERLEVKVAPTIRQLGKSVQKERTKQRVLTKLQLKLTTIPRESLKERAALRVGLKERTLQRQRLKLKAIFAPSIPTFPLAIGLPPISIPVGIPPPILILPRLKKAKPRRKPKKKPRTPREFAAIQEGFLAKALEFKPVVVTPKEVRRLARRPARPLFEIRRAPILIPDIPKRKRRIKSGKKKKRKT